MVKLSELVIFLAAAEHASYSEAAERLNLSQPAVSQNIQQLETKLDAQLFMREGRRMRLSEAGEALVPMARTVVQETERLEQNMLSMRGEILGDLNIGYASSVGAVLLPHLLAAYKREYPRVQIALEYMNFQPMVRRLLDQRLAIALSSRVIEYPGLEHVQVFEDEVILVATAGHPWSERKDISLRDLVDQPVVLGTEGSVTAHIVQRSLGEAGIALDRLQIAMRLDGDASRLTAVEHGAGLAFVSKLAAMRSLAEGHVSQVSLRGGSMQVPIYLVRSRENPFTRAHGRFWAFAQEQHEALQEAAWLDAGGAS